MAAYQLIVLANPVEGKEGEFRTWYDEQHLKDVISVPGIASAARYERFMGDGTWQSVAVYDLSDEPDVVMAELFKRWKTPIMPGSEAFDESAYEIFIMKQSKALTA